MSIVQLQNLRISKDDTYRCAEGKGNYETLAVSGDFGGGTVKPGYINVAGAFVSFKDGNEEVITFTDEFQVVQGGGIGMQYAVDVSGSTNPNIIVEQFPHGR